MGVDIKVNLDQMREVRRQLASVQQALENADDVKRYEGALGSEKVGHALDDFVNNWSQGRDKIKSDVQNLMDRLDQAIKDYEENEKQLVDAMKD